MLYHDWEAETYDDKWSISTTNAVDYARDLFDATVPAEELRDLPYERALELGCGSGFFLLNPIQAGVARRGSVTDLSPGMVKVAVRNGESLGPGHRRPGRRRRGHPLTTTLSTWWSGHAVLHHIPDVESRCARWCGCSSRAAGSCSPASRPPSATVMPATCPR